VIDKNKAAFLEVTPLGLAENYRRFGGSAADICASNLTVITCRSTNIMTLLRFRKIATIYASYIIIYIRAMYYHKYSSRLWLEKIFANFVLLFPVILLYLTI
jgi:hypothetical protein